MWQSNVDKILKQVVTSCVKQSDSPSTLHTYWEEPDQRNTDNSTKYYDTPRYVVDVLGGSVSKTYRRLPESKSTGMLLINIFLCYVLELPTLATGTLSISILEWILYSQFLLSPPSPRYPALQVSLPATGLLPSFRVFVTTAAVRLAVNPLNMTFLERHTAGSVLLLFIYETDCHHATAIFATD